MQEKIIEFIKAKYNPLAIILYGSRSTDVALQHSDWDILCVTNDQFTGDSFELDGESVDLDVIQYPIDTQEMLEKFDGTLQTAKILYDSYGIGNQLLNNIKAEYAKGRNLSDKKLNLRKQFLKRRFKKLQQSQDNQVLFTIHLGVFIEKATQAWYEIINNRWRTSLRSRLITIEREDPDFYISLNELSGSSDISAKLTAAEQVLKKIL